MRLTRHRLPPVAAAGFWSAVLATAFSLAYVIGQLAEWMGLFGSGGGPENGSTPLGLVLLLTPSLLLGSSFLVLMAAVHGFTPEPRKVWSQIALAFATCYAVLISLVYYVQLTFVAPRMAAGRVQDIEVLLFRPFDSFLYSADLLGYSFMSLSTLFGGFALQGGRDERIARVLLVANGLLLPFIALQTFHHPLIYVAALWGLTFPGATASLALVFRKAGGAATENAPTGV